MIDHVWMVTNDNGSTNGVFISEDRARAQVEEMGAGNVPARVESYQLADVPTIEFEFTADEIAQYEQIAGGPVDSPVFDAWFRWMIQRAVVELKRQNP